MLPMISSLGFPGSTFGDCDFAIIGIILGFLGNTFGRMEIYGLLAILLVIISVSYTHLTLPTT